jgi:hypothetical protein
MDTEAWLIENWRTHYRLWIYYKYTSVSPQKIAILNPYSAALANPNEVKARAKFMQYKCIEGNIFGLFQWFC